MALEYDDGTTPVPGYSPRRPAYAKELRETIAASKQLRAELRESIAASRKLRADVEQERLNGGRGRALRHFPEQE